MTEPQPGVLYLIPTPIGNLADLSTRARHLLSSVDVLACEDTRTTRRLMEAAGILSSARLTSFHDHSKAGVVTKLVGEIASGRSVGVVSEAGTPGLSDPGYELVTRAIAENISVVSVPGPNAATVALVGSGLPTDRFLFGGFPPQKSARRRQWYQSLAHIEATLVVYESPHRIADSLDDAVQSLGDRSGCLARELSKRHEEWLRAPLSALAQEWRQRPKETARGELVLVIAGASPKDPDQDEREAEAERLAAAVLNAGATARTARDVLVAYLGLPKRRAYRIVTDVED